MDSLLDALRDGRLIELPDNNKEHALRFLAHILEAVPTIPAGTDVVGIVMARERTTNTAIGEGWACPHARVAYDDALRCVVGWSPAGIDYGAPDSAPIFVITMYLVPDNQRNRYLKEVSLLARALKASGETRRLGAARQLNEIREHLLNLAGCAGEPVTIIAGPGVKHVALAQSSDLVEYLDSAAGVAEALASGGVYENGGWRITARGTTAYQAGRVAYDCLAVRTGKNDPASQE